VAEERWGEQFMVLVNPDLYRQDAGLWWEQPAFMNPANLII
jgi:CRISPR-associated endonuclease/helicase Cas3